MFQENLSLCNSINTLHFVLLYYGRATVNTAWNGTVLDPIFSRLMYIVDGSAYITVNENQRIDLEAGKWYFIPAGCSFGYACEGHLDHISFRLKLCDNDGIDLLRSCRKPCVQSFSEDVTALLVRNLNSSQIVDGLWVRHTICGIVLAMMDENQVVIQPQKLSLCVVDAIQYIQQHLSMLLTVTEITEHIFVSKSTVTKRFQKELSMSVHDYITDTVLFEASQLLQNDSLSIRDISERLGFCDQFYFSRRFREKFGVSPRDYRKQILP